MNAEELRMKVICRPHVVILGAGASIATIPMGDKHERKVSVMNGFIDNLGLRDVISSIELNTDSDNLEDIYSELSSRPEHKGIVDSIEERVYEYFSKIEIPEEITVYDHLILSLRSKDCIATFNWDPLIVQAYVRCQEITDDLPELLFLHGNVSVRTCPTCKLASDAAFCPKCDQATEPTSLLYPVKKKDYNSSPFLIDSWRGLKNYLKYAYFVTIFGYSAPKTDVEAISLLKEAWGDPSSRAFEEIEVIDIRPDKELYETWETFIHTHHYQIVNSFYDSFCGNFPRRSCEAFFDMSMRVRFLDRGKGFKATMSFEETKDFIENSLYRSQ